MVFVVRFNKTTSHFRQLKTYLFCLFLMGMNNVYSLHALCGSDEDGCLEDGYQYCFCIPYNIKDIDEPYCLDLDNLSCHPLRDVKDCHPNFIFKEQLRCLATLYESTPSNICRIVPDSFCEQHSIPKCDEFGTLESCT